MEFDFCLTTAVIEYREEGCVGIFVHEHELSQAPVEVHTTERRLTTTNARRRRRTNLQRRTLLALGRITDVMESAPGQGGPVKNFAVRSCLIETKKLTA
jgi:hypothetical protein